MCHRPDLLILYNAPRPVGPGAIKSAWRESDVGVMEEVRAAAGALSQLGVVYREAGIDRLEDIPELLGGISETVVLNLVESLEGGPLDAASVPAICQAYGKSCTGSDTASLMLALDKWKAKAVLEAAGLDCPWGTLVPVGHRARPQSLSAGRYIVKPALSDASEGIDASSVVDGSEADLHRAVKEVHEQFLQPALIERFVGHRELNVSLWERNGQVEVLAIAEIEFKSFGDNRPRIVGYAAKWRSDSFEFQHTPRIIPAPLDARETASVRETALSAWSALGCRDYARVDLRLDGQSHPFILEVNPNPDISPGAGFPAALASAGVTYDEFIDNLLTNATARRPNKPAHDTYHILVPNPETVWPQIRDTRPEDAEDILMLLERTGRFRATELDVARSVLEDALQTGSTGSYRSFVAERRGRVIGWICFGRTPCTQDTFEIDWLAVSPDWQRRKAGTALLQRAEACLREMGARMIVVQTSGRKDYQPARSFYLKQGYAEVSRVPDFYAVGDDMAMYAKKLMANGPARGLGHYETPKSITV